MKIYIALAARKYGATDSAAVAGGSLNHALAHHAAEILSRRHAVTVHNIAEGYDVEKERELLVGSDLVILQFPMYWFNVPHYLKEYFDNVYISPLMWENDGNSDNYGRLGLLRSSYMLSVTLNAPRGAFLAGRLSEGASVDTVLANVHLTQRYLGMKGLPTYATHNIYGVYDRDIEPQEPSPLEAYRDHLERYVGLLERSLAHREPA